MRSPLWLTGSLVLALTLGVAPPRAAAQPSAPSRSVAPQAPKVWRIETRARTPGPHPNYVFLDNGRPMQMTTFGQERGYLGVQLIELTPDLRAYFGAAPDAGVLISSVEPDSPAAVAGLAAGDVVISADGVPVESSFGLAREIGRRSEGEEIELDLLRDHSRQRVVAVVAERERPQLDVGFMFRSCDEDDEDCAAAPLSADGDLDFVRPDPVVRELTLSPDRFSEAIHELEARMESPEWRAKVSTFQDRIGQLEKRIQELEKRLEEREND
jgi:hypothetical protein